MSHCEEIRQDLGGYVLEGLGATEADRVRRHVTACEDCRAELDEIALAPGLLALVREPGPRAPARVRDRVVARAARRRLRRRATVLAAAVASAAAVLGGVVGWQLAAGDPPEIAVRLDGEEPFEAGGWASFREVDGGLLVRLELEDLEPLDEPAAYEAWLYTTDSRVMSIGQLSAADGRVSVELGVAGSLDDFRTVWVTAEPDARDPAHEGETVLRAAVPEVR